jgi:hypothetical protein
LRRRFRCFKTIAYTCNLKEEQDSIWPQEHQVVDLVSKCYCLVNFCFAWSNVMLSWCFFLRIFHCIFWYIVLMFAHDTLLFCGADPKYLRNLWSLFLCFETVSGLKMNLAKLELVPVGTVDNVVGLAKILGCGVAFLPMKYLDLLLRSPIRLSIHGTLLLSKKNVGWLVGNWCIWLRAIGLPL